MHLNQSPFTGWSTDRNEAVLRTARGDHLFLCFGDHTIRTRFQPSGGEPAVGCWALGADLPNGPAPEITETEKAVIVSAADLSVSVWKDGSRIEYRRGDRTLTAVSDISWEMNGSLRSVHVMKPEEHFYGLGEDNDAMLGSMDRRGTLRDMETGQKIHIGHVTADIPVTFFMSTGEVLPYGLFVDNGTRMCFDMGKTDPDSYSWQAEGGGFVTYLFSGESFADILNSYTRLTGRPSMLPLWAFGYIQCRCSYQTWDEIDEVIANLEDCRFPVDCVVFDYDWAQCFHNFIWNKRWEGRSPEKIAEYRKQGIHFMVSNSGPMIRSDSDNYQSALDAGIMAHDQDGNLITCGHYGGDLMDFTNPAMEEWIRPSLNRLLEDGVESWWLDLTEPEGDPEGTQYWTGDRKKVHNSYCLMNVRLYHKLTRDLAPQIRPFILTRTGTAGIQQYGAAIWSGDVFSDYQTLSAHIPEALNTGMSGIPWWTCDSGGFISSTNNSLCSHQLYNNSPEDHALLFERWLQFACFCPITRVHHAGQSTPTVFGSLVADGAAHYVRLRYRLLPYIYSYAWQAHRTGSPLMRPLVFEYSKEPESWNTRDEYLFGSELLIAPVHEERAAARDVWFPRGTWYDWDTDACFPGGRQVSVYAPQNRIPVFIREGAIIPMIRQTMHTAEIDWKHIDLKIYPHGESRFEMFTDSGNGYGFEEGGYTLTEITCAETQQQTDIRIHRSNALYAADEYMLEIHGKFHPGEVLLGGRDSLSGFPYLKTLERQANGFCFDALHGVLYVKVSAARDCQELNLRVLHDYPLRREETETAGIRLPYLYPPASIPCRIQCENFDRGGEGIAYHTLRPELHSEIYRKEGILIELSDDVGAGNCVRDLHAGEWMTYTVLVREEDRYTFRLRLQGTGAVSLQVPDAEPLRIKADCTRWETFRLPPVSLKEGETVLTLKVEEGVFRANYIDVTAES